VSIPYSGVNIYGASYSSNVKITVGGSSSDVSYTTAQNTPKTFSATDFNAACTSATGTSLNYIVISPPSSSYGTLYYSYTSASNPGTPLTTNTTLYYSGSPYISYLTFVPASNFTGTVSIPYSGVNIYGASYSGNVKITVGGSGSDVSYSTAQNSPKTFSATDFNSACTSSCSIS
jgi:hypothetical protein